VDFVLELMIRARLFRQFMLSPQIQQKGAETLRDSLAFFKLTLGKARISQALKTFFLAQVTTDLLITFIQVQKMGQFKHCLVRSLPLCSLWLCKIQLDKEKWKHASLVGSAKRFLPCIFAHDAEAGKRHYKPL
jgi:hypothetical protein